MLFSVILYFIGVILIIPDPSVPGLWRATKYWEPADGVLRACRQMGDIINTKLTLALAFQSLYWWFSAQNSCGNQRQNTVEKAELVKPFKFPYCFLGATPLTQIRRFWVLFDLHSVCWFLLWVLCNENTMDTLGCSSQPFFAWGLQPIGIQRVV